MAEYSFGSRAFGLRCLGFRTKLETWVCGCGLLGSRLGCLDLLGSVFSNLEAKKHAFARILGHAK